MPVIRELQVTHGTPMQSTSLGMTRTSQAMALLGWVMAFVLAGFASGAYADAAKSAGADVPSQAQLSASERDLLSQYASKAKQLAAFYDSVQIVAADELYARPQSDNGLIPAPANAAPVLTVTRDYKYYAKDATYFRLDGRQRNLTTGVEKAYLAFITPDESFLLGENGDTKTPYLIAHGKDKEQYLHELDSYWFHIAPFSCGPVRLTAILESKLPEYSIERVTDNGDGKLEIEIRFESETGVSTTAVELDKTKCWAVTRIAKEHSTNASPDRHISSVQRCEYSGQSGQIPLLTKCVWEDFDAKGDDEPTLVRRQVSTIKSISEDSVDMQVFDVTRLVGTIGQVKPASPTLRIVGLTIGVVLLAIAVAIKRLH
jgi:hypothetical protein